MKTATITTTTLPLTTLSLQSHPLLTAYPSLSPLSPQNPILTAHILRPIIHTQCRRREAENEFQFDDGDGDGFFRKRKSDSKQWWLDDSPEEAGIIEEVIDSIWILKVLGSYGWLLPFFLISLLTATGPKAFLLSISVSVGPSLLTLAFNKLFLKSKPKTNTRKKRRARTPNRSVSQEEEAKEENQPPRTKERGYYKSWAPSDEDSPVNEDSLGSSNFGGWDELVERKEREFRSSRRSDRPSQPGRSEAERGKFSRRERRAEMPLLLRLLVAVFPFLGSWTKML